MTNLDKTSFNVRFFFNFGQIHNYKVVVSVILFYFLISVIFTHYCLSLSYIFGHVQMVNVCRCDLFGHVQIFWSYSFGHLEMV